MTKKLCVSIDEELLKKIDEDCERNYYLSRTHWLNDAFRLKLKEE